MPIKPPKFSLSTPRDFVIAGLCWVAFCMVGIAIVVALVMWNPDGKTAQDQDNPLDFVEDAQEEIPFNFKDFLAICTDKRKEAVFTKTSELLEQAEKASAEGEAKKAVDLSSEALDVAKGCFGENSRLAQYALSQRAQYYQANEQSQEAVRDYEKLFAIRPDGNVFKRDDFLSLLNDMERHKDALKYARIFAEQECKRPQTSIYRKQKRCDALLTLAETMQANELYKDSLVPAQQALDISQKLDRDYHSRSLLALAKGKAFIKGNTADDGSKEVKEALALGPDNVNNLCLVGAALSGMKRYKESNAMFERSRALPDADTNSYYNEWIVGNYLDMKDFGSAKKLIDKWIEDEPKNPTAFRCRAQYYCKQNHHDLCERDYATAKKLEKALQDAVQDEQKTNQNDAK